ncbi:MAG: AAA family ATPase [Myxococcota bacterium]
MIERVVIENFRSIQRVEVDLAPFTVLVGPNGAGKTNFVVALALLGRMIDVGSTDPATALGWRHLARRGPQGTAARVTLSATIVSSWDTTPLHPQGPTTRQHLRVTAELTLRDGPEGVEIEREAIRVCDVDGTPIVTVEDDRTHPRVVDVPDAARAAALPGLRGQDLRAHGANAERRFLGVLGPHGPWRLLVRQALSVSRFRFDASGLRSDADADGTSALSPTGAHLAAEVLRLRGRADQPDPGFERVLSALRVVYDRIEDVRAVPLGPGRLGLQFQEAGIDEPLDQSAVSDGVLHALAFLVALFSHRRGVLALEEPENALHPWAARALVSLAQEDRGRQLLLTTHSETVVSAIADVAALYLVEHDGRGTHVSRAADREAELDTVLRQTGQRLGDIWLDGSLGGVPEAPQ